VIRQRLSETKSDYQGEVEGAESGADDKRMRFPSLLGRALDLEGRDLEGRVGAFCPGSIDFYNEDPLPSRGTRKNFLGPNF
jgi:hypothetical protein